MTSFLHRLGLLGALALIAMAVPPWGDFQGHTHWSNVGWIPFVSPPVRVSDMVANLLLFMPLGALGALNLRRYRVLLPVVCGCVLSFTGESLQLYSHTRFPSATDLVMNTVGAAAGALIVVHWTTNIHQRSRS